jgi:hypothetical protein
MFDFGDRFPMEDETKVADLKELSITGKKN